MGRKSRSVADLANEAETDLDETLVTLWDAGIDCVEKPSDLVPARLVSQ